MTRQQQIDFINFMAKYHGEELYPGEGVTDAKRRRLIGSCALLFTKMVDTYAPAEELDRLGQYASGIKNGPFDHEKAFVELNIRQLAEEYGFNLYSFV